MQTESFFLQQQGVGSVQEKLLMLQFVPEDGSEINMDPLIPT